MTTDWAFPDETPLDKVMRLQNGLIAQATDGSFDDETYRELYQSA